MKIEFLADHPHLIPTLASWFYEEWGRGAAQSTIEKIEAGLKNRLNRDNLPLTIVALVKSMLVGTASLKIREVETHAHLPYWLGSVYVHPSHRDQGIGAKIVVHAVDLADKLGLNELFLYTHSHEKFYSRLDWKIVERSPYHGRVVAIMRRKLKPFISVPS